MNKKRYLLLSVVLSAALSASAQDVDTTRVRVGYTQGNLQTVAGAVDKVGENRMNRGFVNNSLDALSGQSAGVQVQTGGNQEAMISAVRVRGTTSLTGGNDPLVIIDGVSSDLSTLTTIYPADIESFTILKDASETAQYGSRGAAGVIQVQTKKGKGERFHISYDGTVGFESIYKNVEMLNADQFRRAAQQLGVSIMDYGHDTNFRDDITRTGLVQNHHIAFGGGTPTSNYRASVGIQDHKTVIRNNRVRNYIAKLDVSQKTFDNRISFDLGVFGSLLKYDYLPFSQKLFYSAATFNPTLPSGRNADGSYTQVPEASWISNPNSLLDMSDDENNAHFNVHLRASADMGYGLTLTAFGSFTYNSIDRGHYYPTYVWSHGEAYRHHTKSETGLGNLSLGWHHDFKIHHVELLALAEVEKEKRKGFFVTSSYFNTDAFGYYNLEAGAARPWEGTGSFYRDNTMESFLLRGQYTLLKRYTLTANARVDGSSKVGENNRWGFFPSVSAAWVVSEESWMKPLTWLNSLKLRAGYGRSGNLGGIDSYMSLALVQPNGIVSVNGAPSTTLGVTRNANPDLKWEVKRTFNIGLDAAFFGSELVIGLDYFIRTSKDLLITRNIRPSSGFATIYTNYGEIQNKGLEFMVGYNKRINKDWGISATLTGSTLVNKVKKMGDPIYNTNSDSSGQGTGDGSNTGAVGAADGYHWGNHSICKEGEAVGSFYGYRVEGIINNEEMLAKAKAQGQNAKMGDYLFRDISGPEGKPDGILNELDMDILGNGFPSLNYGLNLGVTYKNFDFTMQMHGVFGQKIFSYSAMRLTNMFSSDDGTAPNILSEAAAAAWSTSNPNGTEARLSYLDENYNMRASDAWVKDANFLKISNIQIGYNLPHEIAKKLLLQSARVYLSIQNVACISGYNKYGDPECGQGAVIYTGLDTGRYPMPRTYALGFNVTF